MSDFANRVVKVFDVLTLTVLFEQGDIDYTMVEYWDCTRAYRPTKPNDGQSYTLAEVGQSWRREPPQLHTCCLACLCKRHGRATDAEDNKGALLRAIQDGNVQITKAYLRTELTRCSGCGNKPTKVVNPQWLNSLKT